MGVSNTAGARSCWLSGCRSRRTNSSCMEGQGAWTGPIMTSIPTHSRKAITLNGRRSSFSCSGAAVSRKKPNSGEAASFLPGRRQPSDRARYAAIGAGRRTLQALTRYLAPNSTLRRGRITALPGDLDTEGGAQSFGGGKRTHPGERGPTAIRAGRNLQHDGLKGLVAF